MNDMQILTEKQTKKLNKALVDTRTQRTEEGLCAYLAKKLKLTQEEARQRLDGVHNGHMAFNDAYAKKGRSWLDILRKSAEGMPLDIKYVLRSAQLMAYHDALIHTERTVDGLFTELVNSLRNTKPCGHTREDVARLEELLVSQLDDFSLLLMGVENTSNYMYHLRQNAPGTQVDNIFLHSEADYRQLAVAVSALYEKGQLPQLGENTTPETLGFFITASLEAHRIITALKQKEVSWEEFNDSFKRINMAVVELLFQRLSKMIELGSLDTAVKWLAFNLQVYSFYSQFVMFGIIHALLWRFGDEDCLQDGMIKGIKYQWGLLLAGYSRYSEFTKGIVTHRIENMRENTHNAIRAILDSTTHNREAAGGLPPKTTAAGLET